VFIAARAALAAVVSVPLAAAAAMRASSLVFTAAGAKAG
jgi:hypothetical protein